MMDPVTKHVVLVGIHFMILFTAFNAFQTTITKIHEEDGDTSLGPFTLAVNYFAFVVANFFVSKVAYSQKWQMSFAAITYAMNYCTGFFMPGKSFPIKLILAAVGALANGIGASFLWTSVGAYIHKVCHLYNRVEQKGHYYGLFNSVFCFGAVLGSIVATFGMTFFSHENYFLIVTGVAILAFLYGSIFVKQIVTPEQKQMHKQAQGFCSRSLQSMKTTIKFYPTIRYSMGLMSIDGISLGVVASTMLKLLPHTSNDHLFSGVCIIAYGFGSVIGGYLGGKLCDKLPIRISSSGTVFIFCMACIFSLAATQIWQLWSALVGSFLWGSSLYFANANLMVICSRVYNGKPQSFALTKQFHSLFFVFYQIVALATNNSLPVTHIMFVLLVFAIPALWGIWHLHVGTILPVQDEKYIYSVQQLQKDQIQQKRQISSQVENKQKIQIIPNGKIPQNITSQNALQSSLLSPEDSTGK